MSQTSRRLIQLWDQLLVKDGLLWRQYAAPSEENELLQLVVPEALREEVLADLHEGMLGGHFGMEKTLARLKEHFYWPGHYNDVQTWCRTCGPCASRKTPTPKARAPLKSVRPGYPLQIVAMDIVGPFPEAPSDNTYILVADYFTRWMEAYAIPNQEAVTVARKLTNEFS